MKLLRKLSLIPVIIFLVFLFVKCKTSEKVDYKHIDRLKPETREYLLARLERGKTLYKKNCSSCHGIFTGGRADVPNFSEHEIEQYKVKAAMRDTTNHAVAQNLTQDNLDEIFMFLRYVKTNAKPHIPHD